LHSGDIGELDDDGFLTITDRKKDILVTAGGKNVAPQNLENALKTSPLISQALVVGDRRPFVAALVTLEEGVPREGIEEKVQALVAALGPALPLLPIDTLRLVVGALLLVFGLQWLRKAILRASGYVSLHDEEAAFARETAEARAAGLERRAGLDWYAFTIAFKGVLLEGLEVAFIVLSFGSTQGSLPLAALLAR